jgi:glycerol-3-phosphate dehydrogenase subunit C
MNILAKVRTAEQDGIPVRDRFIARPALVGRLFSPIAPLANALLQSRALRAFLERAFALARSAPLPHFQTSTLRQRRRTYLASEPPHSDAIRARTIAYFHGCSANYYEPELGELTIELLERLDRKVLLPPQECCGLPLQSNGLIGAAQACAANNIAGLTPFAAQGIPIVGSSTSCTLALKHDYRSILGLRGIQLDQIARSTYDIFELIECELREDLKLLKMHPVRSHVLYHAPCQLRSHGIGSPAYRILATIPGLQLTVSESFCCGVAGTYGLKHERYKVAYDVGESLFRQAEEEGVELVVSDSETCRWWIAAHTGLQVLHPLELLARSLGMR